MIGFFKAAWSQLRTVGLVFAHAFQKRQTLQYPEEKPALPPRYRGRPVLTRDPDGQERCVACGLCAVVCPPDCIAVEHDTRENGRWYARSFALNLSRCVFCGLCEEACPTSAIQLTPDFELGEYRRQDLLFEKDDLLISGPGKDPHYRYHDVAGRDPDRPPHEGEEGHRERSPPVDPRSLLP